MGVPAATPSAPLAPASPEPGRSARGTSLGNVVVVLGVVAVAIGIASYVMPQATRPVRDQPAAVPAPVPAVKTVSHTVVYELFGAHGARNLTYAGEGASLVQQSEVATPWRTKFVRTGPADRTEFYSVSAQNAGTGELRCRIVVDGVVVADKTVSGEGAPFGCAA